MGLLFNYEEIDASEKEAKLKEKVPDLLYPGENVLLAYKCSRDSYHFTQTRIIQKDKKGISGKRTDYKSFPYTSIRAYAIVTAGSLDTDSGKLGEGFLPCFVHQSWNHSSRILLGRLDLCLAFHHRIEGVLTWRRPHRH